MSNKETVEVVTTCPICEEDHIVTVPLDGYNNWLCGEKIQNAMPNVPAEDREMLISGICPSCWQKTFGPIPEEDI